ncbi:UDP-N-acetylmuramoyl-L-alanine--D-glutamate ligase [Fusobacterium sp. MFO224]|uniref:UDP-N-acetylmuramoyl-L-alanine--D-glutamate ligase n=1 Tax=Fusobacterium sp. MFO224 TaxID=3378070 RepID=UPI00385289AE
MKKVMIFGNGVSGNGAKKLVDLQGNEAIIVDDKSGISSEKAEKLLDDISLFIKSPGVPYNNLLKLCGEKGIEVIDEIELAYRYLKEKGLKTKIIAVTGSNGKTTVTSKIQELLSEAGLQTAFAGNIGKSFAELLVERSDLDCIVLECSSFQLENIKKFKPNISLIVNLSPDHLNRYEAVEDYYDTKLNIFKNQNLDDLFIVNLNDEKILERIENLKCRSFGVTISKNLEAAKCYYDGEYIIYDNKKIIKDSSLSLKGEHNIENILFIISVAKEFNISDEIIVNFLMKTKSLEHRMERFYKWNNTVFVNDSKGTNLESTKFAIEAYKGSVLICGGKDKGLPLEDLSKLIKENIEEVYLIGKMAGRLKDSLLAVGYSLEKINSLDTIEASIKELRKKIKDEEKIVLLSPSTSSFDQFKSFEERGEVFKKIVIENFEQGERL